ncbi:stalk domain-containing protein [Paenibacillus sp. FSL F4-0125]|uniref:stalk domain-containing protein n=1 Tax=Paenibacillus sp. FSL F4-0125 TaxID=2954730 RepID=UPI0030FA6FC9
MNKTTKNLFKMSAVGCAAIMGVSIASLPVHAMTPTAVVTNVSSTAQSTTPALTGVKIQEKVLSTSSKYLIADIKVPQLTGMLDKQYQDELNDIILSQAEKDLTQWEKDAAEMGHKAQAGKQDFHPCTLNITYELKSDGTGNPAGVISLKVITEGSEGGTSMPRIDTYNVNNAAEAQRVTLSDLLGANYKEKLDADILAEIKKDPDKYFLEEYKGTFVEQSFFIEKDDLVIVFPKYSIAPGYVGSPEFRFSLNHNSTDVAKLDLKKIASFTNKDGVLMLSLRDLANQLNYELKWNQATKTSELMKGAQWASVSINKDSYFIAKMAPKALGTAPVLQDNKTYVPVQFVTDILHIEVQSN